MAEVVAAPAVVQAPDAALPAAAAKRVLARKEQRRKKKLSRQLARAQDDNAPADDATPTPDSADSAQHNDAPAAPEPAGEASDPKPDIEYVKEGLDAEDPLYSHFADVFGRFAEREEAAAAREEEAQAAQEDAAAAHEAAEEQQQAAASLLFDPIAAQQAEEKKLSRRQLKKIKMESVGILKQKVKRPEVVELHDVNSTDPGFLIFLKSYHNTVPVPRHWCQKRRYLQAKRGNERGSFKLPSFIEATGISKIRESYQGKTNNQAKTGKMDIDYQVLRDAFFKYQTKPKMCIHGDIYYENKEYEVSMKEKRPGEISEDLRKALGMPEGFPPPWLYNMQKYGPPPSYPSLKVPGLNAPIPSGAQYGFHPGGWGKVPVDETGKPAYGGDPFGVAPAQPEHTAESGEPKYWGEIEAEEEEEEEQPEEHAEGEEDENAEEDDEGEAAGAQHLEEAEERSGTESVAEGTASVAAGLETPDSIDLVKQQQAQLRELQAQAAERASASKPLYTVLEQQATKVGAAMMGSTHKYKIPEPSATGQNATVALNPGELEAMETGSLDENVLKRKFEEVQKERAAAAADAASAPKGGSLPVQGEDLSDMVAERERKRKRKEKEKEKSKKFKF
eukprot:m51a1_g1254 hypothetical protein (619) ;mRNA; f:38011-40406